MSLTLHSTLFAAAARWQVFLRLLCCCSAQLVPCRFARFRMRHNLYKLQEERNISPKTFAELVSSTLYEKRWVT